MTSSITNHTFGQMQHAEYEANIRKHQAPPKEQTSRMNLDLMGKIAALLKKTQMQLQAKSIVQQPNLDSL